MTFLCVTLLASGLAGAILWAFVAKKRNSMKSKPRATYGGPIRVTDHQGRNMKITQKDDGSFDMVEEEKK